MFDNKELLKVPGRKYIFYGKRWRVLKEGYQLSEDEIPEAWLESVNTCPCVVEGNCEGVKDPEFFGRCVEGNMGYLDCEVFKMYLKGAQPVYERKDESLCDTKIMHAEDLLPKSALEGAVEEQVNEGIPISRFTGLSSALRYSHHTGSYEEYDHSNQIDAVKPHLKKTSSQPKRWR